MIPNLRLNELANILSKKISPVTTISSISKLFRNYLKINRLNFVIWDDNNLMLKDFVQDWKFYDDDDNSKSINFSYTNLSIKNGTRFYFNGNEFDCEIRENHLTDIKDLLENPNTILYPLVANGEVFGLMNIETEQKEFTTEFFEILNILLQF